MKPFYAIMWEYRGKLHFVGNDPMTLNEAEDVMDKIFNHKNYFIAKCEPIKKAKRVKTVSKTKREYLIAAEVISRRKEKLVVECKKNGKFRSKCSGPIDDLEYKKGILSWSDKDGEVVIAVRLGMTIKDVPDVRAPEFTHSVYVEV
ncbi:MAG: hypothetical protein PHF86_14965 [Candidatus Nanoarchaeia archaeon]|nr:hypothetical protein [Candidatus Nanoarchaeia archaeon]